MRFLSLIFLISAPLLAQTTALDILRQSLLRGVTYANLPAAGTVNRIAVVTDCVDSACSTGGGAIVRLMRDTGAAWAVLGDGNTGAADDTAYDAGTWDANTDAPTKNVVRDKIETLAPLVSPSFTTPTLGAAVGTSLALGTTPASAGTARFPNNTEICWRNAANSADFCLKLNASNEFEFAAPINVTGTAGATLFTGVASPSAPAGAEQWYFYADSVDNLPKYIYNGEAEVTFYTTANPPTSLANLAVTSALAVPQGASPTTDAAGECAIDTTTGQLQCHDGTAERAWPHIQSASFVIPAPADTDDINLMKAPYGMSIIGIDAIVQGTTSVTGQLQECASDGTSCADLDSDIVADADGAADDGSLTDSAIASGAWIRWKTTSVSGTPTFLTVTVRYRVVAD